MKKVLMTALVFALTSMTASAQLLYKISGNGLEKPSYIIGTHHLANVGFVNQINGVTEALTETDQVYGELVWDTMTNIDSHPANKIYKITPILHKSHFSSYFLFIISGAI